MNKILSTLAIASAITLSGVKAGEQYYSAPSGKANCTAHCDSCCDKGFYIFGFGGGNFSPELNGRALNAFLAPFPAGGVPLVIDLGSGYSVGGGAGVSTDFLGGSRLEFEFEYSEADVEGGALNNNPFAVAGGDVESFGFHVNFIKELRGLGNLLPYAGVGIGYTEIEADLFYNAPIRIDDSDGNFSWQVIAGLDYALTDRATIFVQYKYSDVTGDISLDRLVNGVNGTRFDIEDFSSHAVQGGLRISF